VEGNPNIEMRIFLRDKNKELMDQYLNQGMYRSIPVFAFFDENMKEVARFIERPAVQTEEIEKKMLETPRRGGKGDPLALEGLVAPAPHPNPSRGGRRQGEGAGAHSPPP